MATNYTLTAEEQAASKKAGNVRIGGILYPSWAFYKANIVDRGKTTINGQEVPRQNARGGTTPTAQPAYDVSSIKQQAQQIQQGINQLQDVLTAATEAGYGKGGEYEGKDIPASFYEDVGVEPPEDVGVEPPEKGTSLNQSDVVNIVSDLINKKLLESGDVDRELTPEEITAVKAEFEELYGPLYETYTKAATRGARLAVEEVGRVEELGLKREARNLEEALSESRASMAMRGLAFSGIREKEETKEKEISAEQMKEIRDIATKGRRESIAGLEETIGSEAARGLYPEPGYEWLNMPGAIPAGRDIALQQELARRKGEKIQTQLSDVLTRAGALGYNI